MSCSSLKYFAHLFEGNDGGTSTLNIAINGQNITFDFDIGPRERRISIQLLESENYQKNMSRDLFTLGFNVIYLFTFWDWLN